MEIDKIISDKAVLKEMAAAGALEAPALARQKQADVPFLDERSRLEKERQFIIDRRSGIFWKFFWSVITAIITVFFAYIANKFGLK